MAETIQTIIEFLGSAIETLFDWFIGFFENFFTGRSFANVGRSIINIFLNGNIDFSLQSILELLFGVTFIIFAIKMIIHLVRG